MNTLLIDIKAITEWFTNKEKDINDIIKNNEIILKSNSFNREFEIRIKNNTKAIFEAINYKLSLSASSIITLTDETINYGPFRECVNVYGEKEYQYKEKIKPFDLTIVSNINPFVTTDIRFSEAVEVNCTQKEFNKYISLSKDKDKPYIRNRTRTIYKFDEYHIDCTTIIDSKNIETYEIEVEYNTEIKDIGTLLTFVKKSFHNLYPNLHTLFTPDKFKSLQKTVDNRNNFNVNMRQPVNIQYEHLNPKHSYFIGKTILDYSVTNKLDGVNYKCHIFKDKSYIILQNNTDLWLEKVQNSIQYDCLLNAEVTNDNTIHVFDILYSSEDEIIAEKNLNIRLNLATKVINDIKGPKITLKKFFNTGDVVKNIMHTIQYMTEKFGLNEDNNSNHLESNVEKYNDGIILQYNGGLISSNKNKKMIIPSLKWKFPSKITIDFLAKYFEKTESTITYRLYSKWNRPRDLDKKVPDKFIPFQTKDKTIASITFELPEMCDGVNCSDLNDKVLEIGWDRINKVFKLFRIRTDKTKDRTNVLKVSNETYPQMIDIYTLPKMIEQINQIRNEELVDSKLIEKYTAKYKKGQFPFKKLFFESKKECDKEIDICFENLKEFDVFKNKRLEYSFSFKTQNKTFYNEIPNINVSGLPKDIQERIFQYKTEDGNYLVVKTLKSDYENIDKITDYFIEDIRLKAIVKSQQISPLSFFKENEDKIIQLVENKGLELTNYNVRETIFELVKEATLFKPSFCKSILQLLSPNYNTKECSWLDISAGWGDRLITAIASDVKKYVAFDPNNELKKGHTEIINTLSNASSKKKFTIYYEPFEEGIKKLNSDEMFNLVFTSPPFFDFEIYSNQNTQSVENYSQFSNWLSSFLLTSVSEAYSHLEENGYLAIYIVDIKNYNIIEPLFKHVQHNCKNSIYKGMIASIVGDKIPKPVWIWQKGSENDVKIEEILDCKEMLQILRKIHNEYKRKLITDYTKNKTVLDLGSGKGGDIHKYLSSGIKFITMVEPNEVNITECKNRLEQSKLKSKSEVIQSGAENFNIDKQYDVISLFFMLSFFFSSEEMLKKLVHTISKHLKDGGVVIGTTALGKNFENMLYSAGGKVKEDCYTIEFLSKNEISIDLKGTETATFQKEFLVDFDMFTKLLEKENIVLTFFEMFTEKKELSKSENRLTTLYGSFVFKKEIKDKKEIEGKNIVLKKYNDVINKNENSIINCIVKALHPDYTEDKIENASSEMLINLSSQMTIEDYGLLDNGRLAIERMKNFVEKNRDKLDIKIDLEKCRINEVNNIFECIDYSKLTEEEREVLEGIVVYNYESFVKQIENSKSKDTIWNTEFMVNYVVNKVKCNIIIINEYNPFLKEVYLGEIDTNNSLPTILILKILNKYRLLSSKKDDKVVNIFTLSEINDK